MHPILARKINTNLKVNKVRQVKIGLVISVVTLLIISSIIFYVYRKNNQSFEKVTHTTRVMLQIEDISSAVNELEGSHRAYLITGNSRFLKPYDTLERVLKKELNELKILCVDHPEQMKNANTLEQLIDERINFLRSDSLVSGVPDKDGFLDGEIVAGRIMMLLNKIKSREGELMGQRMEVLKEWSDKSTIAVMIPLAFAIVLIVTAFTIIMREYATKVKVEKQLLVFQQQLKDKIEKLDSSNKDLEQFAYAASHDLQEPLRKIMTFSERINHKFSGSINPELKNYLDRMSGAASRMRVLIDDLLAYSRASRSSAERTEVNLVRVFDIIRDNYEVTIQSRGVSFIYHNHLPRISGDQTQIMILFQNLVSNAIKFTASGVRPVIEISSEEVGQEELEKQGMEPRYEKYHRIMVKDNGIGFDEKYADKIFVIFQRLHGRSEYEGTGIGLSICKKIVENHEGYIRARSGINKGSEFYVYLPVIHEAGTSYTEMIHE